MLHFSKSLYLTWSDLSSGARRGLNFTLKCFYPFCCQGLIIFTYNRQTVRGVKYEHFKPLRSLPVVSKPIRSLWHMEMRSCILCGAILGFLLGESGRQSEWGRESEMGIKSQRGSLKCEKPWPIGPFSPLRHDKCSEYTDLREARCSFQKDDKS